MTMLGIDASQPSATLAVLGHDGHVMWRYDTTEWSSLEPLQMAADASGNLFIRYNPGRYDGVVVVGWRGGRVQNFGSLPEAGSYFEVRAARSDVPASWCAGVVG